MIEIINGKVFYRLETKLTEDYSKNLEAFLRANRVHHNEISRIKFDFKQNIGKNVTIKHTKFVLHINIKNEDIVVLLFDCRLDSDEFSKLIEGYFK